MSTRFLTEKDKTDLLTTLDGFSKEIDTKFTALNNQLDNKLSELSDQFYSKGDIDKMFGSYVTELALLIGGIES